MISASKDSVGVAMKKHVRFAVVRLFLSKSKHLFPVVLSRDVFSASNMVTIKIVRKVFQSELSVSAKSRFKVQKRSNLTVAELTFSHP